MPKKTKQTQMKNVVPLGTGLIKSAVKAVQGAGEKRCTKAGGKWVNGACSFR